VSELIPFDYGDRRVRVVLVDGDPWFALADTAQILGYRDAYNASRMLRDAEQRTHSVRGLEGAREVTRDITIISEPGLYRLIMRSRRPEAEPFQDWVVGEVLPAIRKTGSYGAAPAHQIPQSFAEALELAARQARELEAATERVAELEPAARAWEHLADASGDYSLREAAQILDRDPAISTGQNRLSRYLREIGWCDPKGTPYQSQVDLGRLAVRTRTYDHPITREPTATTQIRITTKGLYALHKLMGGQQPLLTVA